MRIPGNLVAVCALVYSPLARTPVRLQVVYMLDRAVKVARQAKGQYGATGRVRDATYVSAYADVLDAALRFWEAGVPGVDQAKVGAGVSRGGCSVYAVVKCRVGKPRMGGELGAGWGSLAVVDVCGRP